MYHTQPASSKFRNCWVEFSAETVAFSLSLSKMISPGKGSMMPNVTNKKKKMSKGFFPRINTSLSILLD